MVPKFQGPSQRQPADLKVRINGLDLSPEAQSDLRSVTVEEDLNAAGMFTLELYNWNPKQLRFTWSDERLFAPGSAVEIWMGYVDGVKKVMGGEIISLEPLFEADKAPTVVVRGYDRRHRLLRGQKTRSFTRLKDSDIAGRIATDAGLQAKTANTRIVLDYVLQHNQTDLAFLQDRAGRIGYEVYVRDKALYFQPPQHRGHQALTLSLAKDIVSFRPRLTTMSQVGEVVVRGWDIKKKEAIVGQAGTGHQLTNMGGKRTGPRATNTAFGKSSAASVERPVFTKAEADRMATGQFNEMAMSYIQGEGICFGNSELRVGTVIKIEEAGLNFSGLYYVTKTTHAVRPNQGYRTYFTCQRNAA